MLGIQSCEKSSQPLDVLQDRLWEEAVKRLLERTASQRLWLLQACKEHPLADPDLTQYLPDLCTFLENSLRLFMSLKDQERDSWLQEASTCGPEVVRFAGILQDLRKRRTSDPQRRRDEP